MIRRVDPVIRITVNGRLAFTVEQAAAHVGVTPKSLSGELSRYKDAIYPIAKLDGLKRLYDADAFDAWWHGRPGRGMPGVKRPRVRPPKDGAPSQA